VRRPIRLLIVTPLYPPRPGGAATYFATLVDHLVSRAEIGRIVVLARGGHGVPRRERRGRVTVLRVLPSADRSRRGGLHRALVAAAIHCVVLATAWLVRADLLHVHTMVSLRGMPWLARLAGRPVIADMRDLAARDEGVSVAAYARCGAVICASENIAAFLRARAFPEDRIHHIPIPVESPRRWSEAELAQLRAELRVPVAAPYVCFVGAVTADKGVTALREAFDTFGAAHPEFYLVLAGPRPAGTTADAPAGVGLAGWRVRDVGPLSHAATLGLLQGASLVILPSRSEGLPRVCLEALALGRKVLCPPGVPELDRACPDFVLPDTSPATIAARMEAVIRSPAAPGYDLGPHDPAAVADRVSWLYEAVLTVSAARPAPAPRPPRDPAATGARTGTGTARERSGNDRA
jgi:glycosyltransferase involved in cell wall biosynthesis